MKLFKTINQYNGHFFKKSSFKQVIYFLSQTNGFSYEATSLGIRLIFDNKNDARVFRKCMSNQGEMTLLITGDNSRFVDLLDKQWNKLVFYWNQLALNLNAQLPLSSGLHAEKTTDRVESVGKCIIL